MPLTSCRNEKTQPTLPNVPSAMSFSITARYLHGSSGSLESKIVLVLRYIKKNAHYWHVTNKIRTKLPINVRNPMYGARNSPGPRIRARFSANIVQILMVGCTFRRRHS